MVKLLLLSSHIGNDIPETSATGQLPHEESSKLRPAIKGTEFLANMMLSGQTVKFMSRKNLQQLMEDCVTVGHGLDLLGFVMFSAKNIITQGALQAYFFLYL
jgi:hypothetical protein